MDQSQNPPQNPPPATESQTTSDNVPELELRRLTLSDVARRMIGSLNTRELAVLAERYRVRPEDLESVVSPREIVDAARAPSRVRLKTASPLGGDALGTVVDVGTRGAVVDWDSGIRNYVEFSALEPIDPP